MQNHQPSCLINARLPSPARLAAPPSSTGHSVRLVTAAAHLRALAGAEAEAEAGGQLDDKLACFAQPKLLVIDALGYLLLEQRGAHLFQRVARSSNAAALSSQLVSSSARQLVSS